MRYTIVFNITLLWFFIFCSAPSLLVAVSSQDFNRYEKNFQKLVADEFLSKKKAQLFVKKLLVDTWHVGSEESKKMITWVKQLSDKLNIDPLALFPQRVTIPDAVRLGMLTLAKDMLKGALSSVGFTTVIGWLTGSGVDVQTLSNAFAYGLVSGGLASTVTTLLRLLSAKSSWRDSKTFLSSFAASLGPSALAPSFFAAPTTTIPTMARLIPFLGDYLAGAVVPGWVVALASGMGSVAGERIVESGKIQGMFSRIKDYINPFPSDIGDFGFEETDLVF